MFKLKWSIPALVGDLDHKMPYDTGIRWGGYKVRKSLSARQIYKKFEKILDNLNNDGFQYSHTENGTMIFKRA